MAERSTSRRSTRGGKQSMKGAGETKESEAKSSVEVNRARISQRIEELTLPILEKYGQPAFDELHARLEEVIREFSDEVQTLFTDLVGQAKTDHDRLLGLLKSDTAENAGESTGAPMPGDTTMSEYERRLENMDKEEPSAEGLAEDTDSDESPDSEG